MPRSGLDLAVLAPLPHRKVLQFANRWELDRTDRHSLMCVLSPGRTRERVGNDSRRETAPRERSESGGTATAGKQRRGNGRADVLPLVAVAVPRQISPASLVLLHR
jgi:hypothetical protein